MAVAPVQIPLSHIGGDHAAFAQALEAHRAALAAHRVGKPGVPVPTHKWDHLVQRVPRGDPYPDDFVIVPYTIVDDTPRTPEQQKTIDTLRATIGQP